MRVLRLSLKYVATLGVYVTYEKIKKYLLMWVEYPTVPTLAKNKQELKHEYDDPTLGADYGRDHHAVRVKRNRALVRYKSVGGLARKLSSELVRSLTSLRTGGLPAPLVHRYELTLNRTPTHRSHMRVLSPRCAVKCYR